MEQETNEHAELHITYDPVKGEIVTMATNATPPELLGMATAILAQLVGVFTHLDKMVMDAQRSAIAADPGIKSGLILPVPGIVPAKGKIH